MTKQEIRNVWMKYAEEHRDLMEGRVKQDIEKYRKGDCKLRFCDEDGKPQAGKRVKITQITHDFKYGANIFMLDEFPEEECNARYREFYKKYFNLATVPFYWDGLEPEEGKPRYDADSPKVYRRPAPDLCVKYCEENGVLPKLHCVVYDKFIPTWLPLDDMAAMEALYEKRFAEIAERYSGRLYEVEIINELLCEAGWTFKSVISSKRDIIEWSFGLAKKYFKKDTLVINEGNPLVETAKRGYRHPYFMMIDAALKGGVDIHKIGLQHHSFTGSGATTEAEYMAAVEAGNELFNPEVILKGLDYYADLGLPLEMTEITVPTFGETEEDELLQADLLELIYTCFFSHPAMETVIYWNLPDGYAYSAPGRIWNENQCRGGLFHHDMTPKKAAERLYELFHKRWHTDLELVTDEEGYVSFRGFYGDYQAEIEGKTTEFGIHRA
nr:endo-1,4-beta-xylanase [uncultured bacterium]